MMSGLLSQMYEGVQPRSVYQSVSFVRGEGCAVFTILPQGDVLRVQYKLL